MILIHSLVTCSSRSTHVKLRTIKIVEIGKVRSETFCDCVVFRKIGASIIVCLSLTFSFSSHRVTSVLGCGPQLFIPILNTPFALFHFLLPSWMPTAVQIFKIPLGRFLPVGLTARPYDVTSCGTSLAKNFRPYFTMALRASINKVRDDMLVILILSIDKICSRKDFLINPYVPNCRAVCRESKTPIRSDTAVPDLWQSFRVVCLFSCLSIIPFNSHDPECVTFRGC